MIIWSSLTRENKKDTLVDAAARGRLITLLFHSFESPPKDLTFPRTTESQLSHYAFGGST